MVDRLPPVQIGRKHKPVDTARGCTERAAADLAKAALSEIANVRRRFETSAAAWTSRAATLRRIEDGAAARARFDASEQRDVA